MLTLIEHVLQPEVVSAASRSVSRLSSQTTSSNRWNSLVSRALQTVVVRSRFWERSILNASALSAVCHLREGGQRGRGAGSNGASKWYKKAIRSAIKSKEVVCS